MALGRTYCFGPTFRAEKSKTRRHLTEFWMVEPEVAYATLDDVMELAEGLVVSVVKRVLERRQKELKILERDTSKLEKVQGPVPAGVVRRGGGDPEEEGAALRVGRRLRRARRDGVVGGVRSPDLRPPLSVGREGVLHEARSAAAGSRAVRRRARPGRLRRNHRRRRSASTTTTCSCSASRITTCRRKRSSGISTCAGMASVPHGGFGMGIERVVSWICGLDHLREAIPYPRMLYRIYPIAMKIGFLSLGCPKNLVDGEVMLGMAREAGHEITSDASECRSAGREHVRLHRLGEAGIDRRHSRDGRRRNATATARVSSSPAAWPSVIVTSSGTRFPRSTPCSAPARCRRSWKPSGFGRLGARELGEIEPQAVARCTFFQPAKSGPQLRAASSRAPSPEPRAPSPRPTSTTRHAALSDDAEALRLREDRGGLRLHVRVLHHPDVARLVSQPDVRVDRRRGARSWPSAASASCSSSRRTRRFSASIAGSAARWAGCCASSTVSTA